MIEAFNADPSNTEVLLGLADMMVDIENWTEAKRYYQAVIQEKPDFADAYNNFGTFLYKQGEKNYIHFCNQATELHILPTIFVT